MPHMPEREQQAFPPAAQEWRCPMTFFHPDPMTDIPDRKALLKCGIVIAGTVAIILGLAFANVRPAKAETLIPHPAGCPRTAFCGCGAAVEIFGSPVRSLWLARAWFKFPKAQPGRNTVGVKSHHVVVLKEHVRGKVWLVADYNSGGHKSRLRQRSIAGFTIVDPGSRLAMGTE